MVTKDVDVIEALGSAILESDAEEIADIGRRAAAELNGDGRGVVGYECSSISKSLP